MNKEKVIQTSISDIFYDYLDYGYDTDYHLLWHEKDQRYYVAATHSYGAKVIKWISFDKDGFLIDTDDLKEKNPIFENKIQIKDDVYIEDYDHFISFYGKDD